MLFWLISIGKHAPDYSPISVIYYVEYKGAWITSEKDEN